jgi:hypothetical protein
MSIESEIDHERRLVTARGRGTLTHEDVFGYQREVWSRADVAGYDELVDLSGIDRIDQPSTGEVRSLATLAASMDPKGSRSKLAIVARDDFAFGLGRMYETYRGLDPRSTKEVRVFRTVPEALAYLRPART